MATKLNLKINQGETYRHKLYWSDANEVAINITGFTARMQVRDNVNAAAVLLELTTENGGIIISNPLAGEFTIYLSDTSTSAISWIRGVYDLEIIDLNNDVTRLVEGSVSVSKEITR